MSQDKSATLTTNKKFKSIIIIVTWNRLDLIKQLVDALKKQKDRDFGVIIIDNGSTDGSREYIAQEAKESFKNGMPIWTFLLNQNTGFALPNNLGITYATEFLDSDYIILLNNDTVPDSDFIKKLHEKADSYLYGSDQKNLETDKRLFPFLSKKGDWKIGSFAPLVENYYAEGRIDAAGIKVSPDGNAINRGVGEQFFKFGREKEVFGPSGSAALHLRKALLDVALDPVKIARLKGWKAKQLRSERIWSGSISDIKQLESERSDSLNKNYQYLPIKEFFSSRYFMYFEDVDLAWRLRLRYWGCVYLPEALILHHHSASSKSYSPFKSYFVHRNQYFNIIRDFPSYFVFVGLKNAFRRYFYLLRSVRSKKGPAAQVAKNSSKMTVFLIAIKGWGSVLGNIFGLLKERVNIQSMRLIDVSEFKDLINCPRFRASIEKMIFETHDFLKGRNSSGGEDKDHTYR